MTFRTIDVPGLPDGIEVRRSTRRHRSVGAHRENSVTVVVVPERMPITVARAHALELHERLLARAQKRVRTDSELAVRADRLRREYLPAAPEPRSIRWSSRQARRWGSCTSFDRSIRISTRLQGMPDYVIDSVIVHELAHLVEVTHSPAFYALTDAFPDYQRGNAFLDGYDFAAES